MMLSFIILLTCFSQQSWEQVSSPISENLKSVCFADAQHGWILSEEGTLLITQNGGSSWQTVDVGEGTYTCVHFSDQSHGCITGYADSSLIMKTTNGGLDWTSIGHQKAHHLNNVYFHDNDIGWAVGIRDEKNYSLYTDDGGNTWTPQMDIFVMNAELYGVHFRDALNGNACGVGGAFFTTNSGGSTGWSMSISMPSLGVDLYSIYNWGMLNGCVVGSEGTALYTTNKWADYVETTTNTTQDLYGVSGAPGTNKIWACGEGGTIIHTPNYIFGWITQETPVNDHLNDIQMLDDENGWAVGNDGTILKYGVLPGIGEKEVTRLEVYPNPTRGIVDCRFSIFDCRYVKIVLFDLHGREISTIVEQELMPGEHSFTFNAGQLTPGVYFLKQLAVGPPSLSYGGQGNRQLAVKKVIVIE